MERSALKITLPKPSTTGPQAHIYLKFIVYSALLQAHLKGEKAMLKVAWLYRQSEVSAEALPTDCDPREVVGRPPDVQCQPACSRQHMNLQQ